MSNHNQQGSSSGKAITILKVSILKVTMKQSCRFRPSVGLLLLFILIPVTSFATEFPFQTTVVSRQPLPQLQILDGQIEAIQQATVSAETSGRITEINFDVGNNVSVGQILIRLTSEEQQAGLTASRAAVREAEARLTEAQNEYQRVENVYAKKLVAKTALDKASADLKAAEQKLKAANANLQSASQKLKYTSIRAPYSGVVVKRLVEVGEAVAPGKPLMEGLSLDKLRVVAQIPQSLQASLRTKPTVTLHFDEPGVADVTLTNLTLSPKAENASFLMRGELPQGTAGVYPGMLVKLQFPVGESEQIRVPKNAVVRRSELTAVYVVSEQRVNLRQIRVGHDINDDVIVLSGLESGEMIALDPVRAGIYLKEHLQQQTSSNTN